MKKLLPYIIILGIVIGGSLSWTLVAKAQDSSSENTEPIGTCFPMDPERHFGNSEQLTYDDCKKKHPGWGWTIHVATPAQGSESSALLTAIDKNCTWNPVSWFTGCVLYLFYAIFVAAPSFLLIYAAKFFNLLASLTLSDSIYKADFIASIWRILRDFANIAFILVLLYAAFQTILGLGHGAKKVIAGVIVVALLVNFSLFFTKIIIDSSNVLALIFYERINTSEVRNEPIGTATTVGQKDIGGAFASKFELNAFFSNDTLQKMRAQGISLGLDSGINNYTLASMMIIYGIVIGTLIYSLIIISLSLLGRTLMLMTLMVVSPLAFVSYVIPPLKKIDTVGFDSWIHKLLQSAFVVTIIMFLLYLISVILDGREVFGLPRENEGIIATLVLIFLPGILITMLLLAGTKYARTASGQFTEQIIKGAKLTAGVAGGLAIGAATGGVGMLGRATVGRAGAAVARSERLKQIEARGGAAGFVIGGVRRLGEVGGKSSFDVRGVKVGGKSLGSITGLKVGEAAKGGFEARRKIQVEKRQKRAKELEVGEDSALTRNVRNAENTLDAAKSNATTQADIKRFTKSVETQEKEVVKAERALKDAVDKFGGNSAQANSARLFRNDEIRKLDGEKAKLEAAEKPIKDAESALKVAQNIIIAENRTRRENYANTTEGKWSQTLNFIISGGQHSFAGASEAAAGIRGGIKEEKK